jgi:hypothetical protein
MNDFRHTVAGVLRDIEQLLRSTPDAFVTKSGATVEQLHAVENRCGIKLPDSLCQLLQFSNGMEMAGLTVLSAEEVYVEYPGEPSEGAFVMFQSWGNGDADGIVVGGPIRGKSGNVAREGNIVFVNHAAERFAIIAPNVIDWLIGVRVDVRARGVVWHPMEYLEGRPGPKAGTYVIASQLFEE